MDKHTILLTGGAGFIGFRTAIALRNQGHRVKIYDNLLEQVHGREPAILSRLPSDIEFIRGDVRDRPLLKKALSGVDYVFHFAALTGVGQSMHDIQKYVDVNCTGTATLLDILVKENISIRRLILSSSRAVYGEGLYRCTNCNVAIHPTLRKLESLAQGQFDIPCPRCHHLLQPKHTPETLHPKPVSIYGWTKKHQEDLLLHASHNGIPVCILRYFNVYGPGQSLRNPYTGIITIFLNRMRNRHPIHIYEHGKPIRDFVYIDDVVRANLLALSPEIPPSSIFNVGSGQPITILEVASLLAEISGYPCYTKDLGEYRIGDIFACVADVTKARKTLKYAPSFDFRKGLMEFIKWAANEPYEDLYDHAAEDLQKHGILTRCIDQQKRTLL